MALGVKDLKEGLQVRFAPFRDHSGCCYGVGQLQQEKTVGRIVYINWEHRWFCVEYGKRQRIGFLFSDIDTKCKLLPGKENDRGE